MKSLVVIAAMTLTVMAAGCMHEQPQIGAKTGTTGSVPKTRFVEI